MNHNTPLVAAQGSCSSSHGAVVEVLNSVSVVPVLHACKRTCVCVCVCVCVCEVEGITGCQNNNN